MSKSEPRGHWLLLLLGGLALAAMLLLDGYAHGAVGESPQQPVDDPAPAPRSITEGGPVINLSGGTPHSAKLPAKTIALTFDDGPDPKWTPRLLDVLRRHGAHATFFTIGAHVAERPGLTRRILREGHEIGNHTYTHVDMAATSPWRNRLELDLTQRALAGAAGVHTRLMRMPYSSRPDGLTAREWRAAEQAGKAGYLVVLTDRDTEDWAGPSAAKIISLATEARRRGEGAIVMLHDSGGDRAATVAAVDQVITRLSADGYRFTTLTEALKLPPANVPAGTGDTLVGGTLVTAQRFAATLVRILQFLFGVIGILCTVRLAALVVFAHVHMRRVRRSPAGRRRRTGLPPVPVSVVVPAFNEEAGILATVRSLLDTDYSAPVEVIVVDDGSTDATADLVAGVPGVRLIRQPNGGKPSALNTGIAAAGADILILVDGDTVFQRDTIGRLIGPLADPMVGAVSGNTKVANRGGLLGRWQHIEYVIGFNLDRRMFDVLECMPTIPGAIGAFRREALAGGVSTDTLAEDTDLTMAICRAGWRVVYEETAVAWTEAPSSLRQLWRQRYRWCYGTMQAMWKHRRSILQRGRSGRFGRRSLTYLTVFQVVLPLFAPVVDVFALYGLLFLDAGTLITMWLAFAAAQMAAGAYALRLDGERLRTLWSLPLQQLVYRQLMYLVVIQSLVTAAMGVRLRWQTIRRTGTFAGNPPELADH